MSDETKCDNFRPNVTVCPYCEARAVTFREFRCGTTRHPIFGGETFGQSNRCRITQLEQQLAVAVAEVKRLKDMLAKLGYDFDDADIQQ